LIRFLGVAFAVMSVVFIGVDLAAGMPWWWAVYEGAVGIVLGALMFFLARPTQKNRQ
jgi:cell division protein FtsW (lipid II flippase)